MDIPVWRSGEKMDVWEPGTHIWDIEPRGPENSDCREAGKGVETWPWCSRKMFSVIVSQ